MRNISPQKKDLERLFLAIETGALKGLNLRYRQWKYLEQFLEWMVVHRDPEPNSLVELHLIKKAGDMPCFEGSENFLQCLAHGGLLNNLQTLSFTGVLISPIGASNHSCRSRSATPWQLYYCTTAVARNNGLKSIQRCSLPVLLNMTKLKSLM